MGKEEFKYIVRIANTDLDGHKPICHAMRKIKGINFMFANMVCNFAKIDKRKKAGDLELSEMKKITEIIENPVKFNAPEWMLNRRKDYETGEDMHIITTDLAYVKDNDIKRLKKIKTNRGLRHHWGLPVRGQRTRSNFRKNKRKGGSLGVKRGKSAAAAKPAAKPAKK